MPGTYPVACECGAVQQVAATTAGGRLACACGRTIPVPSLSRLKAAAGESAASPDLELEHLVLADALPIEGCCVRCGRETADAIVVNVECESATVDDGEMPFWQKLLVGLLTPVVIFRYQSRRPGVYGRDVRFRLPVRLCGPCGRDAAGPRAVRDALLATPVYARLLAKYPHARVARVG